MNGVESEGGDVGEGHSQGGCCMVLTCPHPSMRGGAWFDRDLRVNIVGTLLNKVQHDLVMGSCFCLAKPLSCDMLNFVDCHST